MTRFSELRRASVVRRALSAVLLGAISGYRLVISPWLPSRCRFAPSCSAYAAEAIALHGPLKGTGLAVARVARCHPWHAGGHDPVPPASSSASSSPSDPDTLSLSSKARTHRCA